MENKFKFFICSLLFISSATIADPPCLVDMHQVPGFTFKLGEPITPIYVMSYVQTRGICPIHITVQGLPPELKYGGDTTERTIIGVPTRVGSYEVTINAESEHHILSSRFIITIYTNGSTS